MNEERKENILLKKGGELSEFILKDEYSEIRDFLEEELEKLEIRADEKYRSHAPTHQIMLYCLLKKETLLNAALGTDEKASERCRGLLGLMVKVFK